MAGIAGVIGSGPGDHGALLDRMAASLVYSPHATAETWSDPFAALCRVRAGSGRDRARPVFARDRSKCIVMFGECFGYEQKKLELERQGRRFDRPSDDAEFCLALYEAEGVRGLAALSGSYCLAIYDLSRRELLIISDRLASRPVFYGTTPDGRLIFATQVASVLEEREVSRELDLAAALEFCALQRVLGTRTYHKGVAMLPPASVLRFAAGQVTIEPYWTMQYRPQPGSIDDYAEELAATFRRTVGHVCRGGARVAMLLSGGLDARMVVAAAEGTISCVTFADYMNPEAETARDIAAAKGCDFFFLQREPEHYVRLMDAAVRIGGGMYAFNHAHAIGFVEQLPQPFDVVTHGYAPELLFRGSSLPRLTRRLGPIELGERLDPSLEHSNVAERIFSRGYSLLASGFPELLTQSARQVLAETLAADARQMIAEASAASADVYDQFLWPDVRYHARYPSMLFEVSLRPFMTERSFVFHNEVIDLHLRMPRELRSDNRAWLKALARLDAKIAGIRDANTGFAPGMPVAAASLLGAGKVLLGGLPLLWRLGRRRGATQDGGPPGASPISWPRFDWLIRHNTGLRQLLEETLADPTALPPEMFDLAQVRALLARHLRSEGQHRVVLFALLTFGLWHQKYAG